MRESLIMREIQIASSKSGIILLRNNVGRLRDETGRYVQFGLCKGSSDLIGWRSIVVTPEMVGKRLAIFVACEVKRPGGKPTKEQDSFIKAVSEAGGIATVCDSTAEALQAINK